MAVGVLMKRATAMTFTSVKRFVRANVDDDALAEPGRLGAFYERER